MNGTGPKTNTNNAKFAQALQKKCFQMSWAYREKSFEFEYLGEINYMQYKIRVWIRWPYEFLPLLKKIISNKFPASLSIINFRNVLRGQKSFTRKLFVCLLENYSKFTSLLCTSVKKKTMIPWSACIQAGNLHKQWHCTVYIRRLQYINIKLENYIHIC